MRVVYLIFLGVILALVMVQPAPAQENCQPRDKIVSGLAHEFQEVPRGIGVTLTGNIVELFRSGRTWTIVVTTPDGISCFIAAGKDWETVAKPAKGQGL